MLLSRILSLLTLAGFHLNLVTKLLKYTVSAKLNPKFCNLRSLIGQITPGTGITASNRKTKIEQNPHQLSIGILPLQCLACFGDETRLYNILLNYPRASTQSSVIFGLRSFNFVFHHGFLKVRQKLDPVPYIQNEYGYKESGGNITKK